jgi:hypothetical protein
MSSSRNLMTDNRTPSAVGNSSVNPGDEWSVAYMREESFRQLYENGPGNSRWMNRFRRHRIVMPRTPPRPRNQSPLRPPENELVSPSNKKGTRGVLQRSKFATKSAQEESQECNHPDVLASRASCRTTRDQVDGTSLLTKQNAFVFNRASMAQEDLSVAGDSTSCDSSVAIAFRNARVVRKVSSITMGSRPYPKADWGDPFMIPVLQRQGEDLEEDEESVKSIISEPGEIVFDPVRDSAGSPSSLPSVPSACFAPIIGPTSDGKRFITFERDVEQSERPNIQTERASTDPEYIRFTPPPSIRPLAPPTDHFDRSIGPKSESPKISRPPAINHNQRAVTFNGLASSAWVPTVERPSRRPPSSRPGVEDDEPPAPVGAPRRPTGSSLASCITDDLQDLDALDDTSSLCAVAPLEQDSSSGRDSENDGENERVPRVGIFSQLLHH